jgi:predicted O-methyltransferase YrrM
MKESDWSKPTEDCPHPERWTTDDEMTTEMEVSIGIGGLVRMLQPELCVESGAYTGQTSREIGKALLANGHGVLVALEIGDKRARANFERNHPDCKESRDEYILRLARANCFSLPVDVLHESSLHWVPPPEKKIDFAFVDGGSDGGTRYKEFVHLARYASPGAVFLVHDTRRGYEAQIIERLVKDGMADCLNLPTPRGIAICRPTQRWRR